MKGRRRGEASETGRREASTKEVLRDGGSSKGAVHPGYNGGSGEEAGPPSAPTPAQIGGQSTESQRTLSRPDSPSKSPPPPVAPFVAPSSRRPSRPSSWAARLSVGWSRRRALRAARCPAVRFSKIDVDGVFSTRLPSAAASILSPPIGRTLLVRPPFVTSTERPTMILRKSIVLLAAVTGIAFQSQGCQSGGVGDPCIPEDEYQQSFPGFSATEVNLESRSFQCETRVCLVYRFRGRVSCPLGQTLDVDGTPKGTGNGGVCNVPGSKDPVKVEVNPQCTSRTAEKTVYCSCRCDGADPNAKYCECPDGFTCTKLEDLDLGAAVARGSSQLAGSYCVKKDDSGTPDPTCKEKDKKRCDDTGNCGGVKVNPLAPAASGLPDDPPRLAVPKERPSTARTGRFFTSSALHPLLQSAASRPAGGDRLLRFPAGLGLPNRRDQRPLGARGARHRRPQGRSARRRRSAQPGTARPRRRVRVRDRSETSAVSLGARGRLEKLRGGSLDPPRALRRPRRAPRWSRGGGRSRGGRVALLR